MPTIKSDINNKKYWFILFGKKSAKIIDAKRKGLTLATGKLLVKFQSCGPTSKYVLTKAIKYKEKIKIIKMILTIL